MIGLVDRADKPFLQEPLLHGNEDPCFRLRFDQPAHREDELHPENSSIWLLGAEAEANIVDADHAAESHVVDKEFWRAERIDIGRHDSTPQCFSFLVDGGLSARNRSYAAYRHTLHAFLQPVFHRNLTSVPLTEQTVGADAAPQPVRDCHKVNL